MIKIDRSSQKIKAVFFDLDGVLIDSYKIWLQLFNRALAHFGFPTISDSTFRHHWGQSTENDVRIFMKGKTVDEVRAYFLDHFKKYVDKLKVNPAANTILKYLKSQKLKLACVTNSHRIITETILEHSGLRQFFDIIITADDVENPKPAPDMLIKACTALKIHPAQALFIGDTQTDAMAGKNAGCIVVSYRMEGDIKIDSLSDLKSLLTTSFCNFIN